MSPSIATNTVVDRDELLDFVRPRHRLVLVTTRANGGPQLSPVTGGVDESGPHRDLDLSRAGEGGERPAHRRRERARAVRRVERPVGAGRRGRRGARPARGPRAPRRLLPRDLGEHPDWDEYREAMRRQGKALVRITPSSWGPVATGGFPARLA